MSSTADAPAGGRTDITRLLNRWSEGDRRAFDELMPLVYGVLRDLAGHYMRLERGNHTLQPTALVHEAYLRLSRHEAGFVSRVHFYGAAARAMRRILVDHAREHRAAKRGGGMETLVLDERIDGVRESVPVDVLALDEALSRLAHIAPSRAQLVELRFFGGLSVEETAAFLNLSPATVKRHWSFARAWLYRALNGA